MFSGPQLWQKSSALPEVKPAPGTTGKTSPVDNPILPHCLPSFPSPLPYYPYPGSQLQQKPIALLETMWVLKISVRPHQNHLMLPQSLPSFLNSAHSPTNPCPQLWQKPIVLLEAMMPWTLEALCLPEPQGLSLYPKSQKSLLFQSPHQFPESHPPEVMPTTQTPDKSLYWTQGLTSHQTYRPLRTEDQKKWKPRENTSIQQR